MNLLLRYLYYKPRAFILYTLLRRKRPPVQVNITVSDKDKEVIKDIFGDSEEEIKKMLIEHVKSVVNRYKEKQGLKDCSECGKLFSPESTEPICHKCYTKSPWYQQPTKKEKQDER